MTLSILVFNFYPVTAIMIVLLALFNDGAIISIAYDRTQCSSKPDKWNMYEVLGAGQMTIFLTRTRGPFWSNRPSTILLIAVTTAQIIATFIVVYGLFMTPIGWKWAGFVWIYAFAWFLINDRVKLVAYHLTNPLHAGLLRKKKHMFRE